MTEEIIIDGVDVAGCEYMLNNKIKGKQHCPAKAMPYAKETSCICRKSIDTPYNFCKHNPNCHYKQLKRLEQENKELKEKYSHVLELAKTNADSNEYCLQELEKENKELKETVKDLNQSIQNCNIQRTKMYKALEEIKSAIVEYLPKNPAQYALLEYIQIQINEVLG